MATTTPGGTRRDASMAPLTDLMTHPLDPAYAEAASRRDGRPARRRPWNTPVVGVLALATGVLFAVSAVQAATDAPGRGAGRTDLVRRIEERQAVVDDRAARITALTEERRRADAGALGRGSDEADRLTLLEEEAGAVEVAGPGLRVTLDDAEGLGDVAGGDPREGEAADTGRVQYRDLQHVTNDLWAAGAEAVAINGNRLTSTSSIRFAGRAVMVGFRPLARPYVVEAVMGPEAQASYLDGAGGTYLADLRTAFGVRAEGHRESDVRLPAATALTLRHARPSTPAPTPTATPSARKDQG